MKEVQWRVSSLYVKDKLCSRLIPLAAFFLFGFVHLHAAFTLLLLRKTR